MFFLLLSIFLFCLLNELVQFDRACAIYDSKNTGGLGGGEKLPEEEVQNLATTRRSVSRGTVRKMAHEKKGEKCVIGRRDSACKHCINEKFLRLRMDHLQGPGATSW